MKGSKLALLFLACSAVSAFAQLQPASGPNWVPGYRIRMPLQVVGDETVWNSGTDWIVASVPASGWCRPDGTDLQVQGADGQSVLTQIISCDPDGNTIIQFQRQGQNRNYWVYVGGPMPRATSVPVGQALTLIVRPFQGTNMESWADVLKQLQATPQIQGNAIVGGVAHIGNPFRPGQPGNFAAIYRGFIKIETPGTYLFSSNSDDASFLFVNNQLVYSQTGKRGAGNSIPEWHEMPLAAGLVPIEFYHITGSETVYGRGRLVWKAPDQKQWTSIPEKTFLQGPIAEVMGVEGLGVPAAIFSWGVEDALLSAITNAYLVRFQAHGNVANPNDLHWNFGDGSTAVGASVEHVYFEKGDYTVTLQTGSLPAARQAIYVFEPPVNSSPLTLGEISHVLATMNLAGWNPTQLNRAFDFVVASDQPDRWKIQQTLAETLLANKETDVARRMLIYDALLEAMSQQGHAEEAVKMKDQIFTEAGKSGALRLQASRTIARIQWKYLRNFKEASDLYQQAIEENRRIRLPELRRAAIEWGDMYLEADDLSHAEEEYHLAATLGGDDFASTGQMQAIQRGALLRVAEQQLKAGNIRQSRNLLDRIEIEQPEEKLEGLFRFLRAEVDRQAGRYNEAIKNYEVLLKLQQWSGYRDRALGGIGQCYYHMGEMKKAADIFNALKSSYPEYFEDQQIGKLLDVALTPPPPVPAAGSANSTAASQGFDLPLGNELTATLTGLASADALGIRGNHVLQGYSTVVSAGDIKQPIDTLEAGKRYWVEYWYREQRMDVIGASYCYGDNMLLGRDEPWRVDGNQRIVFDRTFGQWRKVGILVNSAQLPQMNLEIQIQNMTGSTQWDGIRVLPVSDREIDALSNFLQDNPTQ